MTFAPFNILLQVIAALVIFIFGYVALFVSLMICFFVCLVIAKGSLRRREEGPDVRDEIGSRCLMTLRTIERHHSLSRPRDEDLVERPIGWGQNFEDFTEIHK